MVGRHVREGGAIVCPQHELLMRLRKRGLPTEGAERLLSVFEDTLDEHRRHLDRLMTETPWARKGGRNQRRKTFGA